MIDAYQISSQARVNAALESLFVAPAPELARLYEAMRYSVMNGGKRVRPLLAYAACEALGSTPEQANGAACAVELIHAYSLVHDDLPAMDDDDLRRGQPTTHKAFDEACAILAGDGLQSLAFSALLDPRLSNLYVVLHTSLSGSFNESMVKKVGCDNFLSKFQPDKLVDVVRQRLILDQQPA